MYEECKNDILNKCKVISTINVNKNTNNTYNTQGETDEIYDMAYCKSCGTELLSPQELELGLCEDCAGGIDQ